MDSQVSSTARDPLLLPAISHSRSMASTITPTRADCTEILVLLRFHMAAILAQVLLSMALHHNRVVGDGNERIITTGGKWTSLSLRRL